MTAINQEYSRRNFMTIRVDEIASESMLGVCYEKQEYSKSGGEGKANILIIITDQLSQKAIPSYGDKYADIPAIESIMKSGVRFTNVYTPCPLCQPARAAFWTSRYPHQTGVLDNMPTVTDQRFTRVGPMIDDTIPTLGDVFSSAGYITRHFGKMHDAGALRGFTSDDPNAELPVEEITPAWPINIDTTRDRYTTQRCCEFLRTAHNSPFLVVADLNNPHNICCWVAENKGEHINKPINTVLPELPANFETADMDTRPAGVRYLCCTHQRLTQASRWNQDNYRHYLAAYYHYLKRVDNEIALILEALKEFGYDKNTLIVFMADHGDSMAAHRMVTKRLSFYDEAAKVPLAFSGAGVNGGARVVDKPLVSLLDLMPTLCDYARLTPPQGIQGQSLMPYIDNSGQAKDRDYVVSQWDAEWNWTREPGRMLRTKRYKYIKYAENKAEELYDMQNDPGETRNLVPAAEYKEILDEHRRLFACYLADSNDQFESLKAVVDPKWRSHASGYTNHNGGCAKDFAPPAELR